MFVYTVDHNFYHVTKNLRSNVFGQTVNKKNHVDEICLDFTHYAKK